MVPITRNILEAPIKTYLKLVRDVAAYIALDLHAIAEKGGNAR